MKKAVTTYFLDILREYRKRRAVDRLRHAGLLFFILNAAYFFICLFIESVWYLSPGTKEALSGVLLFNVYFVFLLFHIFRDAFFRHSQKENTDLLLHIGQQYPEVRDKLLNHYQLSREDEPLRMYAVTRFIEQYQPRIFDDAYTPKPVRRKLYFSLGLFILLLAAVPLFRDPAVRLLHIHTAYEPPFSHHITSIPADTSLYAYDSLQISIKRFAPPAFAVELYRIDSNKTQRLELQQERDSLYTHTVHPVRESAVYVTALRRPHIFYPRKYPDRDTLSVEILRRPRVRTLDIHVYSPAYSQIRDAHYQGNIDRIRCLRGSRVNIRAALSETAGASFFIFSGDTLPVQYDDEICESTFVPEQDGSLKLELFNDKGIRIREPLRYVLELEDDDHPEITLLRPEKNEEMILTESLDLPFMAQIQDDYGFSAFRVKYSVHSAYSQEEPPRNTYDIGIEKDSRVQTVIGNWKIERFISPGSEVVYYFELADNDTVSGPKITRSQRFYARFPTLGDLYEKQEREQRNTMEKLTEETLESRDIAEEIEEIKQELLQEGELDWEKKTALEESIERLEKSREELENIRSETEEQKRFMEENTLFSDKVMDDFEQLQELMNELIDDELFELLQEIRAKLEEEDSSDMQELLEDFSEKAKTFEKSLDRMLQIFKRIQQEQRLEELAQRMKESLRQQEQMLENAEKQSNSDLASQQEKIGKETEDWEKRGHESAGIFEKEDKEQYDEFLRMMDSSAVSADMKDAAQDLQKQERGTGLQKSRETKEELQELMQSFSEMSSSMMQQQREEIASSFRSAFQKTLYMSMQQEEVNHFSENIDKHSPLLHEFSSREGRILEIALDINAHLLSLSMKTFLVDKALGAELGQVIGNLKSGIQHIEEGDLSRGKNELNTAFAAINRLGRMLLERMENVHQQEGGASGMEFYLQQLQQMAGQQQKLNQAMPKPGPDGRPGSSMMDRLAKLAARQQALRRSLKQIQQGISEGEGGKRVTGDLNRIAADMEKVINELRKNQVRRETVMRQEKIVQRLLDASRSATKRDYKKERSSKTAESTERESPLGLPGNFGEHESLINELRRAVRESDLSPQDKQEMERYLESLLGKQQELNLQRNEK